LNPRLTLLVLALAAALGLAAAEGRLGDALDPPAEDGARWLRARLEPEPPPPSGRVVLVGLDEESHLREPFKDLPRALWTPQIGAVIQSALDAGASVVGLDLVLATTSNPVLKNYDQPLLQALRRGSNENRLVLAAVQDTERPLVPASPYLFAIRGNMAHVRAANLPPDPDGVVRRAPLRTAQGELAFAAEIARRAGAEVPADVGQIVIDATADPTPVVTLSFADLYACAQAGRTEKMREMLDGRVVVVGAMLSDADRLRTGNRFALNGPERVPDARCTEQPPVGGVPNAAAGTVSGAQIQALVVDQLLTGRLPREVPWPARVAIALALALAAALPLALMGVTPLAIGLTLALLLVPLPVAAATLSEVVIPAGRLMVSALVAAGTALVLREALVGRSLRRLRRGFALYLPKPEVDRMLASGMPELGGEEREVTTLFADLAGFTPMAEKMRPPELVALLNQHFLRLGAAVEEHGGFVLQYLGDGMLAVFGAPAPLDDHPTAAVDAAVACLASVESAEPRLRLRVGLATGVALVGNIGSPHRFNYAVVGDVVNLSARLEGMNKQYGTSVMVGESTAARYKGRHTLVEVDRVAVVGRSEVISLFVPRPEPDPIRDNAYAIALGAYRTGEFEKAAGLFEGLADAFPAARALAERARAFAAAPPAGEWDGVFRPTQK
jgi:adenylate cyclase